MNLIKTLSKNLINEMNRINISNQRLSKLSGVNTVTISKIRNQKVNPTIGTVKKLADGLGIDAKILLRD